MYLLIILFTGTATRRADGYPLAQVMCSLAMNMAMGLYSLIAVAFYASSTSYSAPSEYWRRVSLLVSIILAPISFVSRSCITAVLCCSSCVFDPVVFLPPACELLGCLYFTISLSQVLIIIAFLILPMNFTLSPHLNTS